MDYDDRRMVLGQLESAQAERTGHVADLLRSPEDGRVKMHIVREALRARRESHALFAKGRYVALRTTGSERDSVVAFARIDGSEAAITVVPRLVADLVGDRAAPIGGAVWGDARLELPPELADRHWRCALSGRLMSSSAARRGLALGEILASLPVALVVAEPR